MKRASLQQELEEGKGDVIGGICNTATLEVI